MLQPSDERKKINLHDKF